MLLAPGRVRGALTSVGVLLALACQSGAPQTPLDRGHAAFAAGRTREASALYEEAERTQPDRLAEALYGQAKVALVRRRPERALSLHARIAHVDRAYFDEHVRSDYAQTLLHAGRGRLAKKKKVGPAIAALEALRDIDPEYPELEKTLAAAYTAQGEALALRGRRTEALARFEQAMALRPGAADAWVGAAEILIATGRRQEALSLLGDARRHNPSDGRVRALTVQAMDVY